jgi:hypothetical protein
MRAIGARSRRDNAGPPLTFQSYAVDAGSSMRFLMFDLIDAGEGVTALEAMASTCSGQHAEVMAEVQDVLDWAWRRFPMTHGPIAVFGDPQA